VPSYISELLLDPSDESDDEADAADDVAADVVASADNASDVDENTEDDASDLETEPTVPLKTSTTEKVAVTVPKTSKKRGPRGPYKKKPKNSFFTLFFTQLLYYYVKTTFLFYQLLNS